MRLTHRRLVVTTAMLRTAPVTPTAPSLVPHTRPSKVAMHRPRRPTTSTECLQICSIGLWLLMQASPQTPKPRTSPSSRSLCLSGSPMTTPCLPRRLVSRDSNSSTHRVQSAGTKSLAFITESSLVSPAKASSNALCKTARTTSVCVAAPARSAFPPAKSAPLVASTSACKRA